MLKTKKKLTAAMLVAAVLLTWIGAIAAIQLLDPTIAQKTIILTFAAIVSEVALWIGVALLGITALDRFRISSFLRKKEK
ncbi:MAG: hypothetical protein AB3N06_04775 [Erythrobacter sp.]